MMLTALISDKYNEACRAKIAWIDLLRRGACVLESMALPQIWQRSSDLELLLRHDPALYTPFRIGLSHQERVLLLLCFLLLCNESCPPHTAIILTG